MVIGCFQLFKRTHLIKVLKPQLGHSAPNQHKNIMTLLDFHQTWAHMWSQLITSARPIFALFHQFNYYPLRYDHIYFNYKNYSTYTVLLK